MAEQVFWELLKFGALGGLALGCIYQDSRPLRVAWRFMEHLSGPFTVLLVLFISLNMAFAIFMLLGLFFGFFP